MQAYSIHTPAIPRRISLVSPWPTFETLRAQFVYSCRPARPFPAAPFKYAVPGLYCNLHSGAMLVTHRQVRPAPPEKAPRKVGWFEHLLDTLIAWRQTFHVKQSSNQDESWLR